MMNPGLTEEGAKVASSVIEAMRGQPMMLVLIIFNVLLLLLVYWGTTDQRKHFVDIIKVVSEQNNKTLTMLGSCMAGKGQQ
jgi:hypothetical protein